MNKRTLGALIALNVVLLLALVVVCLPGQAQAQAARGPGDYIMVTGMIKGGGSQNAVYVMDMRSGGLMVLQFSSATNKMEIRDGRNITADMAAVP